MLQPVRPASATASHLPDSLVAFEDQIVRHAHVRDELDVEVLGLVSDDVHASASGIRAGKDRGKCGLFLHVHT